MSVLNLDYTTMATSRKHKGS